VSAEQHRDDYAEARRAVREDLRASLFVEAGAGTGKTSALIDRIVALVAGGTPIDRIVAITFTEKAAAELKDRVRAALEEMVAEEAASDRARQALQSLDRAQISTIHAFGLSLMKTFAAEALTDPAFVVQDEIRAERRFDDRWRSYLTELGRDPAATAAIDRILGLGLTSRLLQVLAVEMAKIPGLADDMLAHGAGPEPAPWPDIAAIVESLAALPSDRVPPEDRLRKRVEAILSLALRVARAGEERESVLASGAGELTTEIRQIGRKDAWGRHIDQVRAAVEDARATLAGALDRCRSRALAGVLPYIARFVRDDAAARRGDGTLIFDDLIAGPRDVLRSLRARRALRQRYDVMLIDEFQDTDPLQVEIALAFAADPDTSRMEPGRLFVVGDAKQSIYRFRRADMAIYDRARRQVEAEGGRFLSLALNHRSRPEIIAWVNRVFEQLIGPGQRPEIQPRYRPIHPERAIALRGPGVATIGGAFDGRANAMRRAEARALVATCTDACGTWDIEDRVTKRPRPAAFRDMAILIPTRVGLSALERAFQDAGVPYRVEGGSLIYQTQEVRDLINCLTAIDDPSDEVAVVAGLRSAAFACSDVELARYRLDGGRFNYISPDLGERDGLAGDGSVAGALRVLAGYHEARHGGSLASLIERFVAERGLDEIGMLVQANRDTFRRYRFVVEQARAFEAAGPESLRSFVSWMEHRAANTALDVEGAALDDDEDAVRILTVHGAKGLEFPIVFMAGLNWSPSNKYPVFAVDRTGGGFAVRIGTKSRNNVCEAGDVARLHAAEQDHAKAEFPRVLYVAATRARDHLVVSLYHQDQGPRRQGTAASELLRAGAALGVVALDEPPPPAPSDRAPFEDLHTEIPAGVTDQGFEDGRRALIESARSTRYESATSLGRRARDEAEQEPVEDESEPWKRGRGGTHVGRAVHAALQTIRFDATPQEIENAARAQAVAEAIPHRTADVIRLVGAALVSDAARRARDARRAHREVPFATRFGSTVVEGFVDLVLETEDGLEIIDWKTDQVPADDVEGRLDQYRLQAGLYVAGLEAATGRRVTRVTYAFVSAGVEASPGAPADLALAAIARVNAAR
jgi:ATP-dependent exoDNAse (exonuclease V) beta subunit